MMNCTMPSKGASVKMATCVVRNLAWELPKVDGRMSSRSRLYTARAAAFRDADTQAAAETATARSRKYASQAHPGLCGELVERRAAGRQGCRGPETEHFAV